MPLTYSRYLNLDKLLGLQKTRSRPEQHDESLFIIIHQSFELWFKQVLNELELLRKELERGHTWNSIKIFRRILVIMKSIVDQTDILETMTPLSFNQFRNYIKNVSGIQSYQFYEIETLCGLHYPEKLDKFKSDTKLYKHLKKRFQEHTIWESFTKLLRKKGYPVEFPERVHKAGLIFETSQKNQDILIKIMNTDHEIALLCELLVDFDERLQDWRYRHIKMVERTIGTPEGEGVNDGLKYLKNTLHSIIFPDLWAIRDKL